MRILLTANASYVPPRGGATRSNLVWLDYLAARGHECRVVAASLTHDLFGRQQQIESEAIPLVAMGRSAGVEVVRRDRIVVYSTSDPVRRTEVLRDQIQEFQPDWVLVSSEDLGQLLLREASQSAPGRVVYLAHTPQFYPFGPSSWNPNPAGTELVGHAAAVVAIGHHTAQYIHHHAHCEVRVIHPPIYGHGPYSNLANFSQGLITMINPCAVKGLPIFLETARRMSDCQFGVLPGWGTTAVDRRALEALPNVRFLPNARDIEDVLRGTRILMMPSLWYEGFGLIVMEAMLRGIPVVSSDSGGLVEAKMGTHYVIPVRLIERYQAVFDEHAMPLPVLEDQDATPWVDTLRKLLSDRAVYEEESATSRRVALHFVESLRPSRLEDLLLHLKPAGTTPVEPVSTANSQSLRRTLELLSPERRALLLQRLKEKSTGKVRS